MEDFKFQMKTIPVELSKEIKTQHGKKGTTDLQHGKPKR